MSRRKWTQVEVEPGGEWVSAMEDGSVVAEPIVSQTEQQYRHMWNGWTCAWCYGMWDSQWPIHCTTPGCYSDTSELGGRKMTEDYQRAYMQTRFAGERFFGPSKQTLDREQEILDRQSFKRRTGIWVPGK